MQGIVFRRGDARFEGRSIEDAVAAALADPDCVMVGRNAGSGTRVLIDRLLGGATPPGYWAQPKSHGAVAVAVQQRRADWGIAIESVARQYELGFIPFQEEHYDFVVPRARLQRSPVRHFLAVLDDVPTPLEAAGKDPSYVGRIRRDNSVEHGLVLFVSMIYASVKSLWVGLRVVNEIPGAEVARVWGMALLGSLAGTIFSISTLSFAYKSVLWILFGLVGAWTNCIRHHEPDFTVQLSWKDLAIIVVACLLFVALLLPLFLKTKGVM